MGDFSDTLREAIHRSGLSLGEISRGLRQRGAPISMSALSYWQTGENVPERAKSLEALAHLEDLLGLRRGAFRDLLPPRRPRGRWRPQPDVMASLEQTWNSSAALNRMLAKLDATTDDLTWPIRVSQHATYHIDGAGEERSLRIRRILLAERDNTTRTLFAMRCASLPQPPTVTYSEGCVPGRFRGDAGTSTCLFEFQLDRAIDRGEHAFVEFAIRYPPGQSETSETLRVHNSARDITMHVIFHPDRLPVRCIGYHQPSLTTERHVLAERHNPASFQLIRLDPAPGIYGVRWEWT